MTAPVRVQLRRTRGWRMPPNTVKVDRTTPFGNPFTHPTRAVEDFRAWINGPSTEARRVRALGLEQLPGRNLACWCGIDRPCHVDVWLEVVNEV